MANNRTEQQALIDALAPTVDLVELKAALLQDGYVFRKDVIASAPANSGVMTLDFTDVDQILVGLTGNATLNVANTQNGDILKVRVTKSASHTFLWGGDVDLYNGSVTYGFTNMTFLITNVNGFVTATLLNDEKRSFDLGGNTGLGVTITSQNNFVIGRTVHINVVVSYEGSVNVDRQIGQLPFFTELPNDLGRQDMSCFNATTTDTEGAYAYFTGPGSDYVQARFGKSAGGGKTYYINGVIVF